MMRREDIVRFQRAQPFAPFRIHASNGNTFDIRHPEFLAVSGTVATIVLEEKLRRGEPDDWEMLNLLHIVKVTPLPEPARAT